MLSGPLKLYQDHLYSKIDSDQRSMHFSADGRTHAAKIGSSIPCRFLSVTVRSRAGINRSQYIRPNTDLNRLFPKIFSDKSCIFLFLKAQDLEIKIRPGNSNPIEINHACLGSRN